MIGEEGLTHGRGGTDIGEGDRRDTGDGGVTLLPYTEEGV